MVVTQNLVDFARMLANAAPDEIHRRCAVGRIYYAAFHWSQELADKYCGPLAPGEDSGAGRHQRLYMRLEQHSKHSQLDADLKFVAATAKKLRDLRAIADYELQKTVDANDCPRCLAWLYQVEVRQSQINAKMISPLPSDSQPPPTPKQS
jgi:hypothetical protein